MKRIMTMTGLLLTFFIIISGADVCFPAETGDISRETISGRMTAMNGFVWRYGYDIEMKDRKVLVHVAINLIPADGVTQVEVDRVKSKWEKDIERIWSARFSVVTPAGESYPVVIDAVFSGTSFHHDVLVHPGSGNSDELNWYLLNRPEITAHEFGHMVGVYDEYRRGATTSKNEITDSTSIMKSGARGGVTHARHYEGFRKWFADSTGLDSVLLMPLVEGGDVFGLNQREAGL